MPDSEAKKRWNRENTTFYGLKLNHNTDKDIIAWLEGKNYSGTVKELIRERIKNESKKIMQEETQMESKIKYVVMNKNYDETWAFDTEEDAEKQIEKFVHDDKIEFGEDTYDEYWISEVRV